VTRLPAPTARLVFRLWTADDLPLARALWGDAEVTRLVGGPFDDAAVKALLDDQIHSAERSGVQYFPIFRRDDARHVGCCGLRPRADPDAPLELGFHLRREHWGQGLAREAATSVIAHAFDSLGAPALFAGHHPDNASSRALLLRLGFVHTHDELYPPTGLQHPSYRLERVR
jgi:RimJ/RimL family protein N-acetyltransferase